MYLLCLTINFSSICCLVVLSVEFFIVLFVCFRVMFLCIFQPHFFNHSHARMRCVLSAKLQLYVNVCYTCLLVPVKKWLQLYIIDDVPLHFFFILNIVIFFFSLNILCDTKLFIRLLNLVWEFYFLLHLFFFCFFFCGEIFLFILFIKYMLDIQKHSSVFE